MIHMADGRVLTVPEYIAYLRASGNFHSMGSSYVSDEWREALKDSIDADHGGKG